VDKIRFLAQKKKLVRLKTLCLEKYLQKENQAILKKNYVIGTVNFHISKNIYQSCKILLKKILIVQNFYNHLII
jgi:hypothetical protein